ncbi:MAG: helix-turn-helix transcriptional regulator [Saprospiraceae bacterium]|nr:helix-turn-helix transcriptional regulator [Saprospiraceae bacterium]
MTDNKLPLKKLGDLIYHEGPFLSLFTDLGNMFLCRWVDCNNHVNMWMFSSISSFELLLFYQNKLSLRQYYESCIQLAIVEIDDSLKVKKIRSLDSLPNEYLPKKNSYYVDELYTEFSNSLKVMYLNGLTIITNHKAELYEVLGLNEVNKIDESKQLNVFPGFNINDNLNISKDVTEILQLFRALNHDVRKNILELVNLNPGITIVDIFVMLKIEQSIASQHVSILRRSNLLNIKRSGKFLRYFINHKKLNEVQTLIDIFFEGKKIIYQ